MTVLFVVPEASAPSGGHTYDRRIARAMTALGWPVRTVAVAGGWPRPAREELDGLASVLDGEPDGARVLVDGLVACGAPEAVVPHAARLRLAVLVHLPLADETGLAPETARELDAREREVLRCGVRVVATSGWAARRLAAHHGLAGQGGRSGVEVVAPGVDPAPLARGSGGAAGGRLACVASLTPRKGHDLLFEALAGLRGLPWECVCAGPGAPPPRPGIEDRVRFTGSVVGAELAGVYDSADLLVLASRAETYGMVVTEALARGVPVVAAGVGGVPEALGRASDGRVPGLLVPPGDADALGRALRWWLTDPGLRKGLREAARSRRQELAGWPDAARAMAGALGL
ncbi:glycosyl transferase [Nocardiopsis terrae]|uniref:Glycosyltransferase involved in cell wall biosynthesis n=1 Tax=Nocardiopsis terrae TaxID=372655 RepID=A0ABR9HGN0_9ACTN|nr:glycosyltransferase family 4 protein [Nocardiopsis terrae]MBE1458178.1 glycosyltransferase involved in cell wall biosynthesis [Nocardiopsis terrae]GHC81782.1 glycosyl transferase [Nocardiopsis terrae]